MLLFQRPVMPEDFPANVSQTRVDIEEKINLLAASPQPAAAGRRKKKKSLDFPDKWKTYKAIFAQYQHGKCGYCEMFVIGGQPGDVEHFAPKGEVWDLDESALGQEIPDLSTVRGRKPRVLAERGYWWLAYEWSNYLLACAVCNQYWKGAIFPVQEQPRNLPPSPTIPESSLLLNPYGEIKPGEHLRFSDIGQIEARDQSAYGLATIRTCGLDRDSLVKARRQQSRNAYRLVQEMNRAVQNQDQQEILRVLKDFYEIGREEYAHAGMVRVIFEEQCKTSWNILKQLVEEGN